MENLICFSGTVLSKSRKHKLLRLAGALCITLFSGLVKSGPASGMTYDQPVLAPVAVCRNISVSLGGDGTATITGQDIDGGSYDPDGTIVSRTVSQSVFNCSQTGNFSVTLTVTDNEGLSSSCTATVTVTDNTPPVMACRNLTVYLDQSGTASLSVPEVDNGSSDNCGSGFIMYLSRTSFSCLDIGSPVQVTLSGVDGAGNQSSCISQITVADTISPIVNARHFDLVLGSSGSVTLLPENVDNGSSDNCGSVLLSVSPDIFTCSDQGERVVILTAVDSHGNSSSRSVKINVVSSVTINGMSLSSCDLSPTLALFEADVDGGDGTYSWLWKGLDPLSKPFMVIIAFPPSLIFSNISTLETPFFNNTMADGLYDIGLKVTDGNGCSDSSLIRVNKTGAIFNNRTTRYSEACEGEILTYSVNYKPEATYSWSVINGTILNSDQDTSRISIRWNQGVTMGRVEASTLKPNLLFPGGQCESVVIDSVTISLIPPVSFDNPATEACSDSEITYSLTGAYPFTGWNVTGGVITGGGNPADSFVTIRWGTATAGSITVSAGNSWHCTGSITLNVSISIVSGEISSIADVSCNGGSDGSVSVHANAGSGVPPYSYSLNGGAWQNNGNFTGLSVGNHFVTIRDKLFCTVIIPFIINQPAPVSGSVVSQTNISCFGGSDGTFTVTGSGGVAPYQYMLNSGPYQNSGIFGSLPAGTYVITIRDRHLCTGTLPVTLSQPSAPLTGSATVTNVSCTGESSGRIDLTVTGGTPPYSYLWSNGAATSDLINIPAGDYTVIITDAGGCTFTIQASVSQPSSALSGTVAIVNVLCHGESTGAADLTVTGGTPPYSFLWSNGSVTEDISGLPAGDYSVVITDASGCTTDLSGSVTEPATETGATVSALQNVLCRGGSNGSVTVTGTGGKPPYDYRINAGPFQASGTFGSLTAGNYTITVRDANLCQFNLPVTITEPEAELSANIVSQTGVLCFGGSTGIVTAAGSGGTAPYQFSIDGGSFGNSGTFVGLSAGNHIITIRDANLCESILPVVITQPAAALGGSVVSQTGVSCFGGSTGAVTVSGSGGTPPYMYAVDGGAFQLSGTFGNLPAGIYSFTVRDNNNCLYQIPVTVDQPALPLTVTTSGTDVLCFGGTSGTATATPTGGTSPYTYSWNTIPVQTTATASGLTAGSYTVTVTDSNGCTSSSGITILQPSGPMAAVLSVKHVSCSGGSDGAVDLTVSNGIAPIAYVWNNGATTEDLTGVSAGSYSVVITDFNGCTANANTTVNQPAAIGGNIQVTDVTCFGGNTGSCNLTPAGGTPPYSFVWNNGSVTEDIGSLTAGNYSVTITDSKECTAVLNCTVGQPSLLSAIVDSQTNVSVYGGSDGSVVISGSGGTSPYEYRLNNGTWQPSGLFSGLTAGTYSVTVRDAVLCIAGTTVTITQPSLALTANITAQSDVSCAGGNNGSVSVAGWGGTIPYIYSLDGGAFQASGEFSSLIAGNHVVTVKDAVNDVFDLPVVITEPALLEVSVSGEDIHCFGGSTGTATTTVSGGTPPYSYSWDTSPVCTTSEATGLKAGTYTVTVTDSHGCTAVNSVILLQPAADMLLDISGTDVLCAGGSSGSATVLVTGGLAPYLYSWNTSPGQTKETATELIPGSYSVTVTDSYGCTKTGSVTISEPQPIIIGVSTNAASCPDSEDGTIDLSVTGGIGPFSFLWSDGIATGNRVNVGPGTYSVIVTDNNGCSKGHDVEVTVTGSFNCLVIPQIITPNNDGFNDEWVIRNIDLYPDAEVKVFNRWGKLVFSTRNISDNPWDGRSGGKLVPTDSYHYFLYLNDGSAPKTGVISVIR